MKIQMDSKINPYYVQMLCMLFFPGEKFSERTETRPDEPELILKTAETSTGVFAHAQISRGGQTAKDDTFVGYTENGTEEHTLKIAVGSAMINAGEKLTGFRPSWGMLIGVRPSKVATDLLTRGYSRAETEKILINEYQAIPKKASLATQVALREQAIIGRPDVKDCSVYISIPFCPSRCVYCSFVSYTSGKLLSLIPDYLVQLARDVDRIFDTVKRLGLHVRTVYIGGGTPTILDETQLRFLLEHISAGLDRTYLQEFTLESGRPDTITEEKLAIAKSFGVNRICVNPQILDDEILAGIGRYHTCDEFMRAYEKAQNSGIPIINTDLIAGLPGSRFSVYASSFDTILSLRPKNLTVHTFCVKKSADILRQDESVYSAQGGDVGKCVDYSQIAANKAGYYPYYMYRQKNTVGNLENVGFALDGADGYYNVYMMEEVHSIFAAGAGAVTKMVNYAPVLQNPREGKPVLERLFYPKYPYEYLREDKGQEILARAEQFYEEQGMLS